jgi:hypothetical protein
MWSTGREGYVEIDTTVRWISEKDADNRKLRRMLPSPASQPRAPQLSAAPLQDRLASVPDH